MVFDGTTATERVLPFAADWYINCAVPGVSGGVPGALITSAYGDAIVAVSNDHGVTWNDFDLPVVGNWSCMGASSDGVVLLLEYGTDTLLRSMDSGASWSDLSGAIPISESPSAEWMSIAKVGNTWVLLAKGTAVSFVSTDDGATWDTAALPYNGQWSVLGTNGVDLIAVARDDPASFNNVAIAFGVGSVPPELVALANGTPVDDLETPPAGDRTFYIDVPANATNLTITTSGGTGDADMYVRRGALPSYSPSAEYDAVSWEVGNEELVSIAFPESGRYYILLQSYEDYSGLSITAAYTVGSFWTGFINCGEADA
jgi:hypothetical protein